MRTKPATNYNFEPFLTIKNLGDKSKILKISKKMEEATRKAVEELAIDANVEKVEDMLKIMAFGVMSTPALVVDEKVVSSGKLLTVAEIKELLK